MSDETLNDYIKTYDYIISIFKDHINDEKPTIFYKAWLTNPIDREKGLIGLNISKEEADRLIENIAFHEENIFINENGDLEQKRTNDKEKLKVVKIE